MSELQPSHEHLRLTGSIRQLGTGLSYAASESFVILAFEEYMEHEFILDSDAAHALSLELQKKYGLVNVELFDDVEYAVECYRQIVFNEVVPMYRDTHSADDYEAWLPTAMEVVLPIESDHSAEMCTGDGQPCSIMRKCPIKLITDSLRDYVYGVNFSSYEYEVSKERAYSGIQSLLSVVQARNIISNTEYERLKGVYESAYSRAFYGQD